MHEKCNEEPEGMKWMNIKICDMFKHIPNVKKEYS